MKLPVLVRQALNQAGLQGDWTLTPVGGGDTARSGLLEGGVSRYFVKQHRNPLLLEAEARGLEALAARLSVPRVVHPPERRWVACTGLKGLPGTAVTRTTLSVPVCKATRITATGSPFLPTKG